MGLVLNFAAGWWWADPAAGYVLVYYGAREGYAVFGPADAARRPSRGAPGHNESVEPKKPKPNKAALVLIGLGHVAVTALTWRDIKRRQPAQIRGDKRMWRVLTALNTGNSVVYWVIGRRRGCN